MSKDLRQFLQLVKKAGPDHYVEVKRPLAVDLEVCVLQEKLAEEGRYPVIYCPDMKEFKFPYCTNLFGSYELLGMALDIDPDTLRRIGKAEVLEEYRRRLNSPKRVQWVASTHAPVKDIVMKGKDVDLGMLPILKHSELDSGKCIAIGATISKGADKGIPNMGIYRYKVKGRSKLSCFLAPVKRGSYIARHYAELGKVMEIAIFIGHHPAVSLAAVTRGSMELDELEVAGGFLGEPLRVTKAETVDIPVPADAEIVIEGVIDPSRMVADGPFSESAGYYGDPKRPAYPVDVTCITMRKDAIYHGLDPAHQEHNLCLVLASESNVYEAVKRRIPTLKAVHCPLSGYRFHYYLSIAKRIQGEGMLAGLLAISAEVNCKLAIVVDDDIDVYNQDEVLWAVATRVSGDKDIAVIPKVTGGIVDPRCYDEKGYEKGKLIAKVIIDATKPVTLPYATRITPPRELWESMKLEDYI